MTEFMINVWNSPMGLTVYAVLAAFAVLMIMLVCCVLNIFGFRSHAYFYHNSELRALPPSSTHRAPIVRDGDVVHTTRLPRRGARQIEGHDDYA